MNAALQAVIDLYMRDFDKHLDSVVADLRERIVEYQSVPADEVRASTEAIIRAVVDRMPTLTVDPVEVEPLAELARRRAEQGFPPEALTRSIQITGRNVLAEVDRLAAEEGVDAALLLRLHDVLWQFATDAAAVIATINHDIAVDIGRLEGEHRSEFLRALLRGALPPQQIRVEARNFGLDATIPYYPVRTRPSDDKDATRLSLLIARTGATHSHRPVVATIDDDVVALAPQRPGVEDSTSVVIAVGEPAMLDDAAEQFRAATLALESGLAFGRTGVLTLQDLGALPVILLVDDHAAMMQRQYLVDLDVDQGANLEIARTVWAWLECDQNVDEVAGRMHCHRNTVRYRLTRFKELTGLDLNRTDDLITAWLALGRRAAAREL